MNSIKFLGTDNNTGIQTWGSDFGTYLAIPYKNDPNLFNVIFFKSPVEQVATCQSLPEAMQHVYEQTNLNWEQKQKGHFQREEAKWDLLNNLNPYLIDQFVEEYLKDQDAKTISIIFSKIKSEKAAELLVKLSEEQQIEILGEHLKDLYVSPEKIEKTTEDLLQALVELGVDASGEFKYHDRMSEISSILSHLDKEHGDKLMKELKSKDTEAVDKLERLVIRFEDILLMDDRSMQTLLREISNDEILVALKGSDEKMMNKFFGNMSERAGEMLKEDLEMMGPVKVADVEAAQQAIMRVAKQLNYDGSIIIMGKGSERVFL